MNRKDPNGLNVFQGGFLGLDNIGIFDRSIALPTGGHLEQSDGTARMGMYCLNMLVMVLELARDNDAYEEIANSPFNISCTSLLIEALRRFHHCYGDDFRVECPTGSGRMLVLRRDRRRAIAAAGGLVPAA